MPRMTRMQRPRPTRCTIALRNLTVTGQSELDEFRSTIVDNKAEVSLGIISLDPMG